MRTKIVVGNKFKQFADVPDVITLDQMRVTVGNSIEIDYVMGQGVARDDMRSIGYVDDADLRDLHILTHKHAIKNILITHPLKKTEAKYFCYLSINDACAEMSDHQTGQHVQGALLFEAARQMVIAVTEKYFFPEESKGDKSFITHSIQSKFKEFIFPFVNQHPNWAIPTAA